MENPNELQSICLNMAEQTPKVSWSICIRDHDGEVLAGHDADVSLRTASIGKLFLLAEVARRLEDGTIGGNLLLSRSADLGVADSGLWQHLQTDSLAVEDLAFLIASVSDNLATNVLLTHLGLSEVKALASSLGLTQTELQDRVRSSRAPGDDRTLSVGSAAELSRFMVWVVQNQLVSGAVSAQLRKWLMANVDLSMVASAFGLDPLAHMHADRDWVLWNKTGTDIGIRADVGTILGPGGSVSYAAIANWTGEDFRDQILNSMRRLGESIRKRLEG
jgi:beta-lactamase class A